MLTKSSRKEQILTFVVYNSRFRSKTVVRKKLDSIMMPHRQLQLGITAIGASLFRRPCPDTVWVKRIKFALKVSTDKIPK